MSLLKYRLPWQLIHHFSSEAIVGPRGLWSRRLRYKPELSINQLVQNSGNISSKKWAEARKEILSANLALTEINIDAVIMDTCVDADNENAALSYFEFLTDKNYNINIAIIGKYFKILDSLDRKINKDEEKKILEFYDNIRKTYEVLDFMSCENCILALSKTARWKEALELFDMMQLSGKPKTGVYSAFVKAAFDHDDEELGWSFLKKMQYVLWPQPRVYISYLNYCKRNSKSSEELEKRILKMFEHWKKTDIHPWIDVVKEYQTVLKEAAGWHGKETSVKSSGQCNSCGERLAELKLTPKDFDYLSNVILKKVLIGQDIYHGTTPRELERFKSYVAATKPYDVVIDGLNTAYTLGKRNDYSALGNELAAVVSTFKKQNKKVLVLGRVHMKKWEEKAMSYIHKNAHVFLAQNLTQDDPYLLYATLSSGLNTFFSSRDLMRQHKHVIDDPETERIFRLWHMTRQIIPRYVGNGKNRTLLLCYPPAYMPIVQNTTNSWHIPITLEQVIGTPPLLYEPPPNWICLRKTK